MLINSRKFIKSLAITMTTFFLIFLSSYVNIPHINALTADSFIAVTDPQGHLVGFNNLQIKGKTYNMKFTYGTYTDLYNQKNVPVFMEDEQGAEEAATLLNSALNSHNATPSQMATVPSKYASFEFSMDQTMYLIPYSFEEITRYYGEEVADKSIVIYTKAGIYNQTSKQWSSNLIIDPTFDFPLTFSSITHNVPALYASFNLVR